MSDTLQFPAPSRPPESAAAQPDPIATPPRKPRRPKSTTNKRKAQKDPATHDGLAEAEVNAALASLKEAVAPEADRDFEPLREDYERWLHEILGSRVPTATDNKEKMEASEREDLIFRFAR